MKDRGQRVLGLEGATLAGRGRLRSVAAAGERRAGKGREWVANSLGLGSVSSEQMESSTFETVSAGLHCSLRMSRQIWPLLLMLQW